MKNLEADEKFAVLQNARIAIYGRGNLGTTLAARICAIAPGVQLQMLDRKNLDEAEQNLDIIFHCAGPTGDFRQRPLDTVDAAVTATLKLLAKSPKKMVAASSVRIYGFSHDSGVEFNESAKAYTPHTNLDFIYDGGKQMMESLLIHGSKVFGTQGIAVRLSNLIGGNMNPARGAMLHHALIAARDTTRRVETKQHTACSKDYLHVDDAVQGMLLAAIYGLAGEAYNLASGVALSVQDLADQLEVEVVCIDPSARATHSRIAIGKARRDLDFSPIYNNSAAIARALIEE